MEATILEQKHHVRYSLRSPSTCLMNLDLVLADWLEELAVYGTPQHFQDAETAHHLSQLIRHRYIVALTLAHRPIGLCARSTSTLGPTFVRSELPKATDLRSSQAALPSSEAAKKARENMTPEERRKLARRAAKARWRKRTEISKTHNSPQGSRSRASGKR